MTTKQKQVNIIARIEFKDDPRKVVYLVRSSDGTKQYETSLFDGNATGCNCAARCHCYHEKGCEALESERSARQQEARTIVHQSDRQMVADHFAASSLPAWVEAMVAKRVLSVPALPVAKSLPVELRGRGKVAKSVDLSTKGVLNGNRAFSILKSEVA